MRIRRTAAGLALVLSGFVGAAIAPPVVVAAQVSVPATGMAADAMISTDANPLACPCTKHSSWVVLKVEAEAKAAMLAAFLKNQGFTIIQATTEPNADASRHRAKVRYK